MVSRDRSWHLITLWINICFLKLSPMILYQWAGLSYTSDWMTWERHYCDWMSNGKCDLHTAAKWTDARVLFACITLLCWGNRADSVLMNVNVGMVLEFSSSFQKERAMLSFVFSDVRWDPTFLLSYFWRLVRKWF